MTPTTGDKQGQEEESTNTNSVTIRDGSQTGTITNSKEQKVTNRQLFQQFLESKQFQVTLSKAVAPQVLKQVSSIIARTIAKITHIETHVGELNEYIQGNTKWQDIQSNRQDNLQSSINQTQSSMNSILGLFKNEKEKESGMKRRAPNINTKPIKSPS